MRGVSVKSYLSCHSAYFQCYSGLDLSKDMRVPGCCETIIIRIETIPGQGPVGERTFVHMLQSF